VRHDLASFESVVLAVSGGIDSMVLLDAAAESLPRSSLRVATFNHGTGEHADRAADAVERAAMSLGLPVTIGRSAPIDRPSEEAWRRARFSFLDAVVAEHRAVLCLAHNRDDQVETILFRVLRGAGARGLAGLRAGTSRRPLLGVGRERIRRYASAAGVTWIEDPTNVDASFSRNRIRRDLLPALRRAAPGIDDELVAIGDRAARWRDDLDRVVDTLDFHVEDDPPGLRIGVASVVGRPADQLSILWPALLARIGVAADWRGTRRLAEFTNKATTGRRIPLSGGWVVLRRRSTFEVRRGVQHD
jgi:tRNA(Ile)-lysidine synthase